MKDAMSTEEIQSGFRQALVKFIERDLYLLEHNLNERTITHKLAEYLRENFVDWNVDCEYNRNLDEIKEVSLLDTGGKSKVYPDIIVHQRSNNSYNLLVIEPKKSNNQDGEAYDESKLRAYARELNYKVGVLINFTVGNPGNKPHLKYKIFYDDTLRDEEFY
jgi:hypothetical protein